MVALLLWYIFSIVAIHYSIPITDKQDTIMFSMVVTAIIVDLLKALRR